MRHSTYFYPALRLLFRQMRGWAFLSLLLSGCAAPGDELSVSDEGVLAINTGGTVLHFAPEFTILYAAADPRPAMRPGGIENVIYSVATWQSVSGTAAQLEKVERREEDAGDGFDDEALEGDVKGRSANLFAAGENSVPELEAVREENGRYFFTYRETGYGQLKAELDCTGQRPVLSYEFSATKPGYYSIGYTGAPSFRAADVEEIWQPLIWQEKRLPEEAYMTLAFRCPLPTTLVTRGATYGVVAHPDEFPFDPLPVMNNSRFGVALLNREKKIQPMLFAPVMGGVESEMQAGDTRRFRMVLWAEQGTIQQTFEHIATDLYGFSDYRHNDLGTLNQALEHMVDYSLSDYSWFVDSLKGFAYATDVPGAVKNVSSLHPLELSLVMGLPEMFDKRAFPLIQYMLSREKFLFSLDSLQKIQSPSRNLHGPVAPVSELSALYRITQRQNDFLVEMARSEYDSSRVRNLEVREKGDTWQNALAMYRASGSDQYLKAAEEGARAYISERMAQPETVFDEQEAFFWTGFAPKWIDLIEIYEATGNKDYLEAAHQGARQYAMFCWMSPRIPKDSILVNKGGKAPLYGYLRSKGHPQMDSPEELAPAWRLSEIGLTPESSGTSAGGHRAIFMANYAPWMLRLGYYTGDSFLMNIAKAAVIGRYRNFPGYHINTARTTAYEKVDYPLRPHKELSVNSFHYNHILPMASMLLDYLVTDAVVRSEQRIEFPNAFIEGYAYLQNKFYGFRPGVFYGDSVWLWMPPRVLHTSSQELNYITARGMNELAVAFTNQSGEDVSAEITLNPDIVPALKGEKEVEIWVNNQQQPDGSMKDGRLSLKVPGGGITALKIRDVAVKPGFQESILSGSDEWENAYAEPEIGNARAMIIEGGNYKAVAYIYLRDNDAVYREVRLNYQAGTGQAKTLRDKDFPFEFSIPVDPEAESFTFSLSGTTPGGKTETGAEIIFKRKQ